MNDDEYADLAERTQQIQELTKHPGWDLFTDRAVAEIGKHQRAVLNGHLTEPEYHKEVGWLRGAQQLLDLPALARLELEAAAEERADNADE